MGIKGFGVLSYEAPSAQQHVHDKYRIWTSPRPVTLFEEDPSTGYDSDSSTKIPAKLLSDLLQSEEGLEEKDAERMSAAWAADVRRELDDSGISVLRGLGTFTQHEGPIEFTQDDDFPSTMDMPAIDGYSDELTEERNAASEEHAPEPALSTEGLDDSDDSEDSEGLEGRDSEAATIEAEHGVESASSDTDNSMDDRNSASIDETQESLPEETVVADSTDALNTVSDAETDQETAQMGDDSESEPSESLPILPPPARSRSPRRYERHQNGSSKAAIWVLGIVALIVIIALVYRFTILTPTTSEPALVEQQSESRSTAEDSTSLVDSDTTALATTAGTAAGQPGADENVDDSNDGRAAEEAPDGDLSPGDDSTTVQYDELERGIGGYTLVVGSTMNRTSAREALEQYENLGLPVGVLSYESDEVTRHRIAVGHYETAALADTARVAQAGELPEGTWVLAIR